MNLWYSGWPTFILMMLWSINYKEIFRSSNQVLSQCQVRLIIRQLYYRLVSRSYQLFANTQTNYKEFDKIMTKARDAGH